MSVIPRGVLVYLAVPYSHVDPVVREARFLAANRVAAKLIQDGYYVFSPISHSHPIAQSGDLPVGWDYWSQYDKRMLKTCDALMALLLDGWEDSIGLKAEIEFAYQLRMPVEKIVP